jgi:hypothetical protein
LRVELNIPKKIENDESNSDNDDIVIPDNMKPLINQVNAIKEKLTKTNKK